MLVALEAQIAGIVPAIFKPMMFDQIVGIPPTTFFSAGAQLQRIENPYGVLSLSKALTMGAKIIEATYRNQAELGATRIVVAAYRRMAAKGNAQLHSLVELVDDGILAEIPRDPITGTPFRLDVGTQAVWVPGPKNMTFQQAHVAGPGKGDSWLWEIPRRHSL
jgi:hypothetical protein